MILVNYIVESDALNVVRTIQNPICWVQETNAIDGICDALVINGNVTVC